MNKTVGATLLVAGCSIGAGMLGLPSVTGPAGFFPSTLFFLLSWAFMLLTGLVLAEVTLSFQLPNISFISMAEKTLGQLGKISTTILFALLFYTLMVAYFIGGGIFIADFASFSCNLDLPLPAASGLLFLVLFIAVFRGVSFIDTFNRYLIAGLFLCYLLLVAVGLPHVELERLERADWSFAYLSVPILIISFGYHNLVPSLASYLDQNEKALKRAIIYGSLIPLFVYIIFEFVILGITPINSHFEWLAAQKNGEIITQVLERAAHSHAVIHVIRAFAFFAIATSFLPIAFSFFDFLKDGFFHSSPLKMTKKSRFLLTSAVLVLPFVIALTRPDSFLLALEYAGGFCAVALFGMLPPLMALFGKKNSTFQKRYFRIANRPILLILLATSFAILLMTLLHRMGRL